MSIKKTKKSLKSIDKRKKRYYTKQKTKNSFWEGDKMSSVTDKVSNYIKEKGINVSKISRDTGIPYMALYDSLLNTERKRDLRDYEFMGICFFLGIDPKYFAERGKGG